MSSPNTDPEVEVKRHKAPLIGIFAAVAFALVAGAVLLTIVVGRADQPEGAEQQVDGRTGEVEESQ